MLIQKNVVHKNIDNKIKMLVQKNMSSVYQLYAPHFYTNFVSVTGCCHRVQ